MEIAQTACACSSPPGAAMLQQLKGPFHSSWRSDSARPNTRGRWILNKRLLPARRAGRYEKRWEGKQIESHPEPPRHITQFNALIINSFEIGSLSVQLETHASSLVFGIPTVLIYEYDIGFRQKSIHSLKWTFCTIRKYCKKFMALCRIYHSWIPQSFKRTRSGT
jgi:hypothetical protein